MSILEEKSIIYWCNMSILLIFCRIFCGNYWKFQGRVAEVNKLFPCLRAISPGHSGLGLYQFFIPDYTNTNKSLKHFRDEFVCRPSLSIVQSIPFSLMWTRLLSLILLLCLIPILNGNMCCIFLLFLEGCSNACYINNVDGVPEKNQVSQSKIGYYSEYKKSNIFSS